MFSGQYKLDKFGFVPDDINVGEEFSGQKVRVLIKVLQMSGNQAVPELNTTVEIHEVDSDGFIYDDLCLDPEFAGADVQVDILVEES